jgi:hypothetical protein
MGGGGYRNTTGSLAFRRDRLKRPLRRVSVGVAGLLGAAQVVCRNDARASRWRIVPAAGATAKGSTRAFQSRSSAGSAPPALPATRRHRASNRPAALEDRRGVLLDLVVRRQVERPSHGFVVHRAEQRLDVLLEAHPFVSGGQQRLPRICTREQGLRPQGPGTGCPKQARRCIVASEHSRCAVLCSTVVDDAARSVRRSVRVAQEVA